MTSNATATLGLHAGFFRSAAAHPDRHALEVGTEVLTYGELKRRVCQTAGVLARHAQGRRLHVGVLTHRSITTYTAILGTLAAGGMVVPLNAAFPPERTRQMIDIGAVDALVVEAAGERVLSTLLAEVQRPLLIVVAPDSLPVLTARWPNHRFVCADSEDSAYTPVEASPDTYAYLFFTSGSTGVPKGVGVLHRNAARFVEMSMERYRELGLDCNDRFSQFYDITFDSSMFDLFVGWAFGACLCCPTVGEWINPNKFIQARALTVIDIVPSTGHAMNRGSGWRPGRFPLLRLCRFGGEALPATLAATLAAAAPNAAVDNVYGPTECTVDAAYYRWHALTSLAEATHGIVPIGLAGPGVGLRVVDADLAEVPMGQDGELLISGPQVTPGYWQSPQRTAQSFVRLPGSDVVHYRTGDLVRRVGAGEPMPYLGRIDHQIKISGVRVELGEVEQALRRASGTDTVVAVGWPVTPSGASGIVGFVAGTAMDGDSIRRQLKDALPSVMVPRQVRVLDDLPLNVNGKVDRKALLERLNAEPSPG